MERNELQIDFGFISKLEGSSKVGYVPNPDTSRSGVTIASGFDIGQYSVEEIENAFSNDLSKKLIPYAGLIKNDAVEKLESMPLEISESEVEMVNSYAHSNAVSRLLNEWDQSAAKVAFSELASECQTVITSVAFQYGSLSKQTPNFWRQVTNEEWEKAVSNLYNFGDLYPTRRKEEGDLLSDWLKRSEER